MKTQQTKPHPCSDEANEPQWPNLETQRERPNKAQPRKEDAARHSPSPQRWQSQIDDLCEQRNEYKRHADKLAEALRKVKHADDHGLNLTDSINGALAALAAYEAAQ